MNDVQLADTGETALTAAAAAAVLWTRLLVCWWADQEGMKSNPLGADRAVLGHATCLSVETVWKFPGNC